MAIQFCTHREVDLIATYVGYDCKVSQIHENGREAFIRTLDGAPQLVRGCGPSATPMVAWVPIKTLEPAECSCTVDGPTCRACCDWHALTGEEMPF